MLALYQGNLSAFERQYYAASFARQQALYLGYFAQHQLEQCRWKGQNQLGWNWPRNWDPLQDRSDGIADGYPRYCRDSLFLGPQSLE